MGGDFERKGGVELLEAFARLPTGTAELILVTKAYVPRPDGVAVIDDLTPNDPRLVRLFNQSDVFALPSRAEAFGIAAVEASAAGLPVIASDVGGLADIVDDGVTGLKVPARDVDALEVARRTLLESREARLAMGAAARQRAVERFDVARNASVLLDVARSAALQDGARSSGQQ